MKVVIVTGTPGTGKTIIAKKLAKKFNLQYLDVNKLVSENKLSQGYDRKRRTKVIDVNKLNKILIGYINFFKNKNNIYKYKNSLKNIKKYTGMIIDSHLSHYLPKKYVDFCIVAKCDIMELNKRLKKRKYKKSKIQENLQAEIFDVCYNEALERKHKVLAADTTKGFNISTLAKLLLKD